MKERRLEFQVGPQAEVEVRIASGHIQVLEGPAGSIGVSIRGAKPDKLLVGQFGDHIQIGEEGRFRGSYRIRLEVPAGTGISTAVASGDIDVQAPVGEFRARSASGDINLQQATGRVEVQVASGDVTINNAGGDTRVTSSSGDVKIARAESDCSVATASGDVDLGSMCGDITVKTASGDVRAGCCEGDAVIATSISGRLDIRIKAGRRVDVDIKTLSGRVDLPTPSETPSSPDRPEVRLVAKSVSGNINIGRAAI